MGFFAILGLVKEQKKAYSSLINKYEKMRNGLKVIPHFFIPLEILKQVALVMSSNSIKRAMYYEKTIVVLNGCESTNEDPTKTRLHNEKVIAGAQWLLKKFI